MRQEIAVVIGLLATLGCQGHPPAASAAPPPVAKARPARDAGAAAGDRASARAPSRDLRWARLAERALCSRQDCCVTEVRDGGLDGNGRSLVVATVGANQADCLVPGRPALPARKQRRAPPEAGVASDDDGACRAPRRFHLVIVDGDQVRRTQLLTSLCPDTDWEDLVDVDEKKHVFEHIRQGGRQLGQTRGVTIGLDPPRLLSQSDSADIPDDDVSLTRAVRWDGLTREETWPDLPCADAAPSAASPTAEPPDRAALSIPTLALPAAFVDGGWKTTAFAACGILIDGDQHGYTLHGAGSGARDASMRVVASADGALFIEVTDDKWIGPSKSWVKDDHVEIWFTDARSTIQCGPESAVQWGVRIADGAVFDGFGTPGELLGVEVVRRGAVARLKIPFANPTDKEGLAVVYSDSDDGKKQKRLIATARLARGRGDTLGIRWIPSPDQLRCTVKGRALAVVSKPLRPAEEIGGLESLIE